MKSEIFARWAKVRENGIDPAAAAVKTISLEPNFSQEKILGDCRFAIELIGKLAEVSYLLSDDAISLPVLLGNVRFLRKFIADTEKSAQEKREAKSMLIANLNMGFPVNTVKAMFSQLGKLSDDEIEAAITTWKQGKVESVKPVDHSDRLTGKNNGQRDGSDTAKSLPSNDSKPRRVLDWASLTDYLAKQHGYSGFNLKKAYQERSSVRKIFEQYWTIGNLNSAQVTRLREVLTNYIA